MARECKQMFGKDVEANRCSYMMAAKRQLKVGLEGSIGCYSGRFDGKAARAANAKSR